MRESEAKGRGDEKDGGEVLGWSGKAHGQSDSNCEGQGNEKFAHVAAHGLVDLEVDLNI